ncbi:NADH-quinone oxidoreductase subunit A [Coxiella endosymbiont of Amblyomma americanum]|uniref:NADH-quinone oxidoreductase subunit A n=1 Tax=Coxiella endosymbiont of Amblyomma americanum TaxID=325775 RepID=UPI00057CA4CD|nr:NADH-quinone oxidoreductase subunit A [Coxiella endosymbiont of Amblyomma americanum]AJC50268.1 NADH dehydrogenase subunit A [Coxiella endosymbiont of Amblyomma americanum]AUJ58624.1 NADH-quinone oxidoreductase subunit A [Coxiella-like endosymbiont of Amblyomma americanum]
MLMNYFSILVFIGMSAFVGALALIIGWILGPRRPYRDKLSPYECGFEIFQDARLPFDVRFYLVAILFIIFDSETAFLLSWAVVLRHISHLGFLAMIVFLIILTVGFIYEWKRGALEWK